MKRSDSGNSVKKKSKDSDAFPEVIPYSAFSAVSIELQPQKPIFKFYPRYAPPRTLSRRIEPDQSTLPIPKTQKKEKKHKEEKKEYQIYQFSSKKMPSNSKIIPEFDVIKPLSSRRFVSWDKKRKEMTIPQFTIFDLLTPHINRPSSNKGRNDDISKPTHISLDHTEKSPNYEEYLNQMFRSVMAPRWIGSYCGDLDPPIYYPQKYISVHLPELPISTNISLIDKQIAAFEKKEIFCRHKYKTKFSISQKNKLKKVTLQQEGKENEEEIKEENEEEIEEEKQEIQGKVCQHKYITKTSDLKLSQGEFVVVECSDKHPIIRPFIGMSARLTALIDRQDYERQSALRHHQFDKRIPIKEISSFASIQQFTAQIPPDTFVLTIASAVSTAALSPHKSRSTDFIISFENEEYPVLLEMPPETYLSTIPESTVSIPHPLTRRLYSHLSAFDEDPLPTGEELCKIRSIIESIESLRNRGVYCRANIPFINKNAKVNMRLLRPEIRALIRQYLRILRTPNWVRSDMVTKARLGLTKSVVEIINTDEENDGKQKSRQQLRREMTASFQNNLAFIQAADSGDNNMLVDLDFRNDEEEEEWNESEFNESEIEDAKKMAKKPSMAITKINWTELGISGAKMRKVMKTINFNVVDNLVIPDVTWTRDKDAICACVTKHQESHQRMSRRGKKKLYFSESDEPTDTGR